MKNFLQNHYFFLKRQHFFKMIINKIKKNMRINKILGLFSINIEFGKYVNHAKDNSLIIFPVLQNTLCCGISAIVAFKKVQQNKGNIKSIENLISLIKKKIFIFSH